MLTGSNFMFILLAYTTATILYRIYVARQGTLPPIRRIAGLDAIEEAVGRATELGRPVLFTPGRGGLLDNFAAQTLAGLEIMGFVARTVAKYDAKLIVTIGNQQVLPLAEQVARESYLAEGRPDAYNDEIVRFLSPAQWAYAAATLGIMHRERVASTIMVGAFWAESLMLAEGGAQVGAVQIAGTARLYQIPFFVAACDYVLIGEEMFAGGAYLGRDPVKMGSLAGQDLSKLLAIIAILVGAVLATANNEVLKNLFLES